MSDLTAAPRPDAARYFGRYGGRFVPETLVPALDELDAAYALAKNDAAFNAELQEALATYTCRPTPLYEAGRLSERYGLRLLLKREDLNHTGAHKINNVLGQIILARRMGKRRIIAETGAGQHGVATACAAARFGMECEIYMGEQDIARQKQNVLRMELLGAKVTPVRGGSATLKDATNEAIRDWVASCATTHYLIGSAVGPHPYPAIVRDFQSVIGREARAQCLARFGRLPDGAVACVGGGSNAIGLFYGFLNDHSVRLFGVEAAGDGLESGRHAATLSCGSPGVLHGSLSYLLQDGDGQVSEAHSVSAGLDYPGIGPEHSHLHDTGRVSYLSATDEECLRAFEELSVIEGIIPAFESAHALAKIGELKDMLGGGATLVICLSGRGDKDLDEFFRRRGRVQ